jgi:hypothetical protein
MENSTLQIAAYRRGQVALPGLAPAELDLDIFFGEEQALRRSSEH